LHGEWLQDFNKVISKAVGEQVGRDSVADLAQAVVHNSGQVILGTQTHRRERMGEKHG